MVESKTFKGKIGDNIKLNCDGKFGSQIYYQDEIWTIIAINDKYIYASKDGSTYEDNRYVLLNEREYDVIEESNVFDKQIEVEVEETYPDGSTSLRTVIDHLTETEVRLKINLEQAIDQVRLTEEALAKHQIAIKVLKSELDALGVEIELKVAA